MFTGLKVRLASFFIALAIGVVANAGHGSFSVSPSGGWSGYEYCSSCGTPATISGGGTLSDGKVIENIGEISISNGGTWFLDVSGFMSDPGFNYIDHVNVQCDSYPFNRTLSVSNYWGYDSGSGWAYWELYDFWQSSVGDCWTSSSSKSLGVVD